MTDGLNRQALPVHHTKLYKNYNFEKGWHFMVFWSGTCELGLFFPVAYFICVWHDQTLAQQLYRDKGLLELGIQTAGLCKSSQSLVFVLKQLHFGQ